MLTLYLAFYSRRHFPSGGVVEYLLCICANKEYTFAMHFVFVPRQIRPYIIPCKGLTQGLSL